MALLVTIHFFRTWPARNRRRITVFVSWLIVCSRWVPRPDRRLSWICASLERLSESGVWLFARAAFCLLDPYVDSLLIACYYYRLLDRIRRVDRSAEYMPLYLCIAVRMVAYAR